MEWINGFINKYWIWILCGIFLLLRVLLECTYEYEFKIKLKSTIRNILFLFFLIILWNLADSNKISDNTEVGLLMITIVYIFYLAGKKAESTGGYIESILLIINIVFITSLAFLPAITSMVAAILIIGVSIWVSKHWHEKKSDLIENIAICAETIFISIIMYFGSLKSYYYTFLYLCIEESIMNVINQLIRKIVQGYFNEEVNNL